MNPRPPDGRRLGHFRRDAARQRFMTAYDDALAYWPTAPEQQDVETRFGPTHVLRTGVSTGTPIVLLHGMAVSSPSWFADVEALGADHPLYTVDTITDVGRSTQTSRVRDGVDLARWLDDVLAALHLDAVHLVGLSYGGWLALNQARHSPGRLASITAVDPPGAFGRAQLSFLVKILPDSILALAKSEAALHRLLRRLNNGTVPGPPLLDLSVAGLRSFVAKQPYPKRFSDDDLRSITVPALLLFCGHSPVNHASRAAQRARDLVADVAVDIVPDAGHMLPVEQPELFTRRVLTFVQAVDAAGQGSHYST